jgi:hypothetical protein
MKFSPQRIWEHAGKPKAGHEQLQRVVEVVKDAAFLADLGVATE